MKQTFTLLTKTLLLLCVLLAGSASAWGEDTETVTLNNATSVSGTDVTFTFADGGNSNKPLLREGEGIRCYPKNTMTVFSSTKYISKIELEVKVNASSKGIVPTSVTVSSGTCPGLSALSTSTTSGEWNAADDETNNVVFTVNGSAGNIHFVSAKVYYVETSNPKITLDKNSLDFGDLFFGQTESMTFTVTPANLTGDLTISCNNDKYEVSPATIAQEATTATTVKVTAKPTAKDDDMEGTVTISGGGIVSKSVALTANVICREAVAPVGPAGSSSYSLVTDASTLKAGDVIIIANAVAEMAMSKTSDGNNRPAVAITINDDGTITPSENTQEIVLEGDVDAWYFNVGTNAYLYAASSSKNYLKTDTKSTVGDNGKATITSDDNNATIVFQGSYTRNNLRYNPNDGSPLFSCYASTSTMAKPQIYRRNVAASFDLTVGPTGWRTLVASVDATLPAGLKAYTVTASTNEKATLTEVTSVKANTAYLLNGKANKYTLSVAQTADEPSGNLLKVSTETTGNGVYVLANNGKGVGFYKWAGGSLGAGRVYLPAPTQQGAAREFIAFGISEQTAIEGVAASVLDGQYYDLQGRSVAQPRKGLYIVNGKKVVIK